MRNGRGGVRVVRQVRSGLIRLVRFGQEGKVNQV